MHKQSFDPIIPKNAKFLILGSLPGDFSIKQQAYYGHPQNRFWKLLFHIFHESFSDQYEQKIQLLNKYHIALWDVCASAYRPGSMDTNITEVTTNDISRLLAENPTIEHIIFNGQKAQNLFDKHFERQQKINYHTLPSTSPANAQFTLDKLLEQWKIITN